MTVTSALTFLESPEMMRTEEVPKLHLNAKPEISDRITPKSKHKISDFKRYKEGWSKTQNRIFPEEGIFQSWLHCISTGTAITSNYALYVGLLSLRL